MTPKPMDKTTQERPAEAAASATDPSSDRVAALIRDVSAHIGEDAARIQRREIPEDLEGLWRSRLAPRLTTLPDFEAFQQAVQVLVVLAVNVRVNVHHDSGTAMIAVLDEICAPIVAHAESLARRAAEAQAARLTGRAVEKTAPRVGAERKPRPDSVSLREMKDFVHRV